MAYRVVLISVSLSVSEISASLPDCGYMADTLHLLVVYSPSVASTRCTSTSRVDTESEMVRPPQSVALPKTSRVQHWAATSMEIMYLHKAKPLSKNVSFV